VKASVKGALPLLAVTSGDPNGIGPEVGLRALLDPAVRRLCRPLLVGEAAVFEHYRKKFRIPLTLVPVAGAPISWGRGVAPVVEPTPRLRAVRIVPGRPSVPAGLSAGRAIECALRLWKNGEVDGLVTGPIAKDTFNAAGYRFPGQTEMLADFTRSEEALMLMLSGPLRIGLATIHIPLRRVPAAMDRKRLARTIRLFVRSLEIDFGVRTPRLAVLGLNPHAGEGGLLGSEELDTIIPAITAARRTGSTVSGPFPADGFFGSDAVRAFDGVLAMYHDQGLIPLKMGGFSAAVNFTAGLPLVRTSPGHGTAWAIAGKGVADPGGTVAAILAAAEIVTRRRAIAGGRG
jgi:4-hydroxythreonine-4-phosphate dehydrogenase